MSINTLSYYQTYHGHLPEHLEIVLSHLRCSFTKVIFLVGDSSLDNKFWIRSQGKAVKAYEDILSPPEMKADVCYWMNHEIQSRGIEGLCCINAAVEESTLSMRSKSLLPQDEFVRNHLTENDTIVVSVGGNDIALAPSLSTIISMLLMVYCSSKQSIEQGTAWGTGHLVKLFRDKVQSYLEALVSKCKPKCIIVCMIYFPQEEFVNSWANTALSALRYQSDPSKLQTAIREIYQRGTRDIAIEGVEMVYVPLFEAMDGKTSSDYVERVEPSDSGGHKLAKLIIDRVF